MTKHNETNETNDKILQLARERFQIIHTAEMQIREAALEDIRFAYNIEEGQWDASVRAERITDKRPTLTANKLRKFVSIVANRERENRVAVKVRPVDDQADVTTAAIIEDLVRQIEYQSVADEIYANAGEQAVAGGFGFWRLLTKFTDDGFDQEIFIKHMENPFSVYLDPKGQYCFIRDVLTEQEFERQYPNASKVSFDLSGRGEEWTLWYEPSKIFVAEYFQKEPTTREIAQVRDSSGQVKVLELREGITVRELTTQGFQVLKTRSVKTHKVMWYKMTGHEILESSEWAGSEIPVVEVMGDQVNIAGKIYKRSLIRDGKDPQRMYNYWLTAMTEKVALVPKSPFLATPQQIQGHEAMWDQANQKNFPYLLYNVTAGDKPERQIPAQVDTGAMAMINIANNDIKDVLGMFESTIGEPSNERSGRAIFARQQRSDLGTFHFPDNLRRAVVQTGRLLIDLIPRIYDTKRVVRLRNEKDEERFVTINETVFDEETGREVIVHDLSIGRYDVLADVRLYSTRRQETVELMISAMQFAPQIAPFIVDLIFKFLDSPGAPEIQQRVQQFLNTVGQGGDGAGGQVPEIPGLEATRRTPGT